MYTFLNVDNDALRFHTGSLKINMLGGRKGVTKKSALLIMLTILHDTLSARSRLSVNVCDTVSMCFQCVSVCDTVSISSICPPEICCSVRSYFIETN